MTALSEKIHKNISQIFRQNYATVSVDDLKEIYSTIDPILVELDHINTILAELKDNQTDEHPIRKIEDHKARIRDILKDKWKKPAGWDFSDRFPEYVDRFQVYLEKLPEFQRFEQSADRFYRKEDDPWHLIFRKFLKRVSYRIWKMPFSGINMIRKIFHKPLRSIPFWGHTVPVRGTAKKIYGTDIIKDLQEVEKTKFKAVVQTYLSLKMAENLSDISLVSTKEGLKFHIPVSKEQVPAESVRKTVDINLNQLSKDLSSIISGKKKELKRVMEIAGTMEYPASRLKPNYLNRQIMVHNRNWLLNEKNWSRTLFALFDDWRLDLEINHLKYTAFLELIEKKKRLAERKKQFNDHLQQIDIYFSDLLSDLAEESGFSRKKMLNVKLEIQKKIKNGLVISLLEQLDTKILMGIIRQIEIKLENQINSLSEVRALVKTENYARGLKENDINYISPSELILFDVFPKLTKSSSQLKNSVFSKLEDLIRLVPDIDNIVLFSIDTVLKSTESDDIDAENSQVIINGINRARNRIVEIEKLAADMFGTYDSQLSNLIQAFTEESVKLTKNENALEIQLKVLRAKAIEQTRSYRSRILSVIKSSVRKLAAFINKIIHENLVYIQRIRRKFFPKSSDNLITQEISEFLSESQNRINQLPVIYRRLYSIEPVTDMDLFIGRNKEFELVKDAYQAWINDKASSVAIIGEKWSGLSSFINYITSTMKFNYPVLRIQPAEKNYHEELLLKLISNAFSFDNITGLSELVDAIRRSDSRKIVILEDMQHLYLRSVNGFEAMKKLLYIISMTYDRVFWITSCTQYAWSYLSKTLQIEEHFHYISRLGSMDGQEITGVISKRNQIGGFKIIFEMPDELSESRKFKVKEEAEKQEFLKNRFFRKLNDFASSNISMALIFWLLSTKKVTEDRIIVGDFQSPDQSFLKIMTPARIYILLALILHDGLTVPELSRVNNQDEEEVQLRISSLLEDGIVIRQNGLFMVNPLIYRNVVSVLQLKNLIH